MNHPFALFARVDRTRAIAPATIRIDNVCYDTYHDRWWDEQGPVGGLHEMNPVRAAYFDTIFQTHAQGSNRESAFYIDVGCGGGILTEELARRGYSITGFDISESSLEAGRRHAAACGVKVTYRQGSAYALGLPDTSVEGAVISDVLEHLLDLSAAIRELARVLKPGGILAFDTINRTLQSYITMILFSQNIARIVDRDVHDWTLFITPAELNVLLEQEGFQLMDLQGLAPADPLWKVPLNVIRTGKVGAFRLVPNTSGSYVGYAKKK